MIDGLAFGHEFLGVKADFKALFFDFLANLAAKLRGSPATASRVVGDLKGRNRSRLSILSTATIVK